MYKTAFFIWFGICNYLFFIPANKLGKGSFFLQFKNADKLVHALIFFILVVLCNKAFHSTSKRLGVLVFGFFIYGILVEFIQKYVVPSRGFDVIDIVADTVGIVLALIFIHYNVNTKKYAKQ